MQRTGRGSRTFPRNDRADQFVTGEVLLQPPGLRRKNPLRRSVYARGTMSISTEGMPKTLWIDDTLNRSSDAHADLHRVSGSITGKHDVLPL